MWAFGHVEDGIQTGEDEGGVWVVLAVDWISVFVVE
jgi:hypothetical protein